MRKTGPTGAVFNLKSHLFSQMACTYVEFQTS